MSTGIPAGKSGFKPILWTPGDWNAFFCFGTNILVVTGLLLFVLKMPGSLVVRVIFCIANGQMVLLHGFIKKTQKTPVGELELALKRKKEIT